MKKFRLHVVALPHTQTNLRHSACAFTIKVLRFCRMMASLGHDVFHYGVEGSEVQDFTTEDVSVISAVEQEAYFGPFDPNKLYDCDFSPEAPYWKALNERSAAEINRRKQPGDIVCIIMGRSNLPLVKLVPDLPLVEFGIGYNGPFSNFRVYESYAHMHKIWGAEKGYDPNASYYEVVIPNYYDPSEYPFKYEKEDYFLYLGRLVSRKGIAIAVETCQRIGAKLVLAGQGCTKVEGSAIHCADGSIYEGDNLVHVGCVIGEERAKLFQNARAVIAPTIFTEPFCGVAVEAQLSGTPVITAPHGAFSETVEHGRTGFRCHTLDHFVWAAKHVHELDPRYIHQRAVANYSMDRVRWMYQEYFEMIDDLRREGWYEIHEDRQNLDWLRRY